MAIAIPVGEVAARVGDTTDDEQAAPAGTSPATDTAEPPPTEVEITVAGHTVVVKASQPMAAVADQALALFRETAGYARRVPAGFAADGGQIELAPRYVEPGLEPDGPDDESSRLGS